MLLVLMAAGIGIAAIALGADLLYSGGPQGIGLTQVSLALSGAAILPAGVVGLVASAGVRHLLAADALEAVMTGLK